MDADLLFKNVEIYRKWAEGRRPGQRMLAAKLGRPEDETEFQAIGLTVMEMIDQIHAKPDISEEQYGAMRHVLIQQLFDIWKLPKPEVLA